MLERAVEDDRERPDEHDEQVDERDAAEPEPTHARASWRSGGSPPIASSSANEITSSTTATAAAPAWSPLSIRPKMKTDETSVLNGRLPVMITSEPNSPTAFANASATPDRIPGRMFGKTTRRKVCSSEAPSERGRLLHLAVELEQDRLHRADDERQA